MTFDSLEALKSYILSKSGVAIKMAQEKVFRLIEDYILKYYTEFDPAVYERTYQLLCSLVKTAVVSTGNGWVAEVYFDASTLDYHIKHMTKVKVDGGYMNPYNHVITSNGVFQNSKGDANKVLESAAHGSHGGYTSGTAIWDDPMKILNKEAYNMLKKALIDAGIPVK